MNDYHIRAIPKQNVNAIWRFAEPFVKRALDHTFGEIDAEAIRLFCGDGEMQLWMIVNGSRVVGATTTQLILYPCQKVCRIVTVAGTEFDEWKAASHAVIEAWAMDNACDSMETYIRKGFVTKLKELGYAHRYAVMHKSLKG